MMLRSPLVRLARLWRFLVGASPIRHVTFDGHIPRRMHPSAFHLPLNSGTVRDHYLVEHIFQQSIVGLYEEAYNLEMNLEYWSAVSKASFPPKISAASSGSWVVDWTIVSPNIVSPKEVQPNPVYLHLRLFPEHSASAVLYPPHPIQPIHWNTGLQLTDKTLSKELDRQIETVTKQ